MLFSTFFLSSTLMTKQKNNQDKCDKSKAERPGPTKKQNSKYTNLSPCESKEAT